MSTREKKKERERRTRMKKDKALLSGRCNADTDETADKKKFFFKEKQFNDDSTHFLFSLYFHTCSSSRSQVTFSWFSSSLFLSFEQNLLDLFFK
jgi:hypothetical protein